MIRRFAHQMSIVLSIGLLAFVAAVALADEATSKLPVPSDNDLKESQAVLRDIFKDDIQQATTPTKRSELAGKFLEQAIETKDDPAGRYALLQAAKNLAVRAGDLELTMKIVEELCRSYQVDALGTKVAVIKEIASGTSTLESNRALCESALHLLPDILIADDYEAAKELAEIASNAARKAKDLTLAKQAQSRLKEIEGAAAQYATVKASGAVLEKVAADAKANLVVGRFRCFVKGDWKHGLSMLAMGDDAAIKALAEQDLAEPGSATAKVKVGDGWWALGEAQEGIAKQNLQQRAGYWYEQALSELAGLTKAKVEKRLSLVSPAPATPSTPMEPSGPVGEVRCFLGHLRQVWNVAVAPDGKKAISVSSDDVRLWNLFDTSSTEGQVIDTVGANSIAFSQKGNLLAYGLQTGQIKLRSFKNDQLGEPVILEGQSQFIPSLEFSSDGKTLASAGGKEGTVTLSDVTAAQPKRLIQSKVTSDSVWSIALAPHAPLLAVGIGVGLTPKPGEALLFDMRTMPPKQKIALNGQGIRYLTFSPDGKTLATAGLDKVVRLWSVATGKTIARFERHTGIVVCVAISPSGKRAISCGGDNSVRLWDLRTCKELQCFEGHTKTVSRVAFTPDGQHAVSCSEDRTVRLWRLPAE